MKLGTKSILSTTISIAFGFALGFTAAHWHRPPPHQAPFPGSDPGGHFLRRMADKLDLNQKQQSQIQEIFRKHKEEMKAVHDEMFPKIEVLRNKIDSEIKPVLTEEQQKRFEQIRKKREKFRKGFFDRKGHKGYHRRHHRRHRPSDYESMGDFGHHPPPPPPPMEHGDSDAVDDSQNATQSEKEKQQ